jgi:hypothetical protein
MKVQGLNYKTPIDFLKKKKVQGITFTRDSVAYDRSFNQIPSNVPRFNQGSLGQGLLIEETTTNLFPSAQSQSFTGAWTSGTLNGTYTVSINAGGSLVLSGGATGTCAAGGTLTFTVSNATVTFTPTGTPTHSQLELKGYSTSWTLGGTTRAAETCTIPSNVLNIAQGTIELEMNFDDKLVNTLVSLLTMQESYNKNRASIDYNYGFELYMFDSHNNQSHVNIGELPIEGIHKITVAYDSESAFIMQDGNKSTMQTVTNPHLPELLNNIEIGNGNGNFANTFLKNIVFSNVKRSVDECSKRATSTSGFLIDKNVTLAMPNLNKLIGYYETK